MISFQDPERPQVIEDKKIWLDTMWMQGKIGDSTYLRSLFIAGDLPDVANSRLNCLRMEKEQEQRVRLAKFLPTK
jgi:hypothetical protein